MRSLATPLLLLALLVPGAARAQPVVEDEPGFLALDGLEIYQDEDDLKIEVTLHGGLIAMVASFLGDEQPEVAEALSKIRSIRFRLFEVDEGELPGITKRTASAAALLEKQGWQRIVRIKSDEDQSYLYLRWRGKSIVGLTALFVEQDGAEGSFGMINVVGEIDPAQIGRIGQQLDIDILERAHEGLERGGLASEQAEEQTDGGEPQE